MFRNRRAPDKRSEAALRKWLWEHFGEEPFERGNLDAGRLSWLFGREVVAVDDPFDPTSYDSLLRIDAEVAERSFPEVFNGPGGDDADDDWDDWD